MAVDGAGNLYIADRGNHRIRRVDATGTIITLAGTGERGYSGDGGPAVQAQLFSPRGVAVDRAGNLYIADNVNHRVRRVDANGIITTNAGSGGVVFNGGGFSGDGGPAVQAQLSWPEGVAVDGGGNLFIADTLNRRIRRVDANGTITTLVGTGYIGYSGDGGPAVEAQLSWSQGVAVDGAGNLYIADRDNHRIRRVDVTGTITTLAGTRERGYSGDGGPAVEAQLFSPEGVAVDGAGNLFIADRDNHRIRRVGATGTITTIAGTGEPGYSGDGGPAVEAQLSLPKGVAVDGAGNLYIADTFYHRIRRVDANGTITTFAGVGERGLLVLGDGGPAVEAHLSWPEGVAVDGAGNLFIADTVNHRIRRVDANGIITTIAGTGRGGYSGDGGPAVKAQLYAPKDVTVDGAGNLYITDAVNHRIRRVDANGIITTIAGTGRSGFSGDGGPAVKAQLYDPRGVAVDGAGNLYIADAGNRRIRKVSPPLSITLQAPTGLTAMAVSSFRIELAWRDNSSNETGFKVQRRLEGSGEWAEAGTTAANATTYSDMGLLPATAYRYRVQAFNDTAVSAFSNEAMATTQAALPPTLTQFAPTTGPVGTRVTLTGTGFLGATDVLFNGVSAVEFEVVSGASIEAVVPPGATSGPISVVTPAGTAVSTDPFTMTDGGSGSRLFVPVILTSAGRNNAFFTSELTLTNRGSEKATLHYTYTARSGGGNGTATDRLAPGRQRIKSDAIGYLQSLGIPIPNSGNRIGTLRVEVFGSSGVSVVTRTTTAVPEGRAGLSYPGIVGGRRVPGSRLSVRPAPEPPGPLQRRPPEHGGSRRRPDHPENHRLFRGGGRHQPPRSGRDDAAAGRLPPVLGIAGKIGQSGPRLCQGGKGRWRGAFLCLRGHQ